mgnify:CR=1 FL=1
MTICLFRTDTTDLFAEGKHPRMMRLQAELWSAALRPVAAMDLLIRPDGWVPNAGASATHGITVRQCELYGTRCTAALAVFMDMVRSAGELVSWPMDFHAGVVNIELRRLGARPDDWTRGGLVRTCLQREASERWNSGKRLKIDQAMTLAHDGQVADKMEMQRKILWSLRSGRPDF